MKPDKATTDWIRNRSDELAVENGCRFDVMRGAHAVWWIERFCRLYEGATGPMRLVGCHQCGDYGLEDLTEGTDWEDAETKAVCKKRAEKFAKCVKSGHRIDWQYDCVMRLFGWVKESERLKRPIRRFREGLIFVSKKNKKALALDTPIPTPAGWTTMGELKAGDAVFGPDGSIRHVEIAHPQVVDEETYEITFSNGEKIVCNGEHLWKTKTLQKTVGNKRKSNEFTGNKWTGSLGKAHKPVAVRRTADIARSLKRPDGACNHSLSLGDAIDLPHAELPIPPYVLGCWLGDGDSDQPRITCHSGDRQIIDEIEREGVPAGIGGNKKGDVYRFRIGGEQSKISGRPTCRRGHLKVTRGRWKRCPECDRLRRAGEAMPDQDSVGLMTMLRRVGVLNNKHIPQKYLRASRQQRIALLQGLMDTDGCIDKSGKCLVYCTKLAQLAKHFGELLSSLGIKFRTTIKRPVISGKQREYHYIQFHAFRENIPVFRLKRKLDRMRTSDHLVIRPRSGSLQVTAMRRIPAVASRCITIDHADGMFLCGRTMIPTHNSPSLAAIGTYLLIGDGEQGQKVYLAAKDGTQARDIAGGHVIKMVEKSEELGDACTINKNLMRVTHESTDSWLQPLSSANETTQKSKEGLNGSVLIDEVHVVDRKFVNRISRAGISRDEPLHLEFSTAGDDPDSYGFERFEFGLKVAAGDVENQGLFVAIYAAPQDLKDEDLAADPLKYAHMANPAMGHTVDPDEWMHDYQQSKDSPAKLAVFKMYRLNIWQGSASPWLPMDKWRSGARDVSIANYYGRKCWAALDLSTVKDFSCLCLCFPEENGEFTFFWWFWLPEDTKRAYRDLIPVDKWLADDRCNLTLIPGGRVDHSYIRSAVQQLSEQFDIQQLLYDDWNAEKVTQEISEGTRDHTGRQVTPGTGIERVNFGQGIKDMNEPTKHFEGLIIDSKCLHNGDPIATWMAGNATIKPDVNGNYKPLKPREGIKKIDGVVAAVMAFAGAEQGESEVSVYDRESRGFIVIG